jgi:type VI secretion system protein ImpB
MDEMGTNVEFNVADKLHDDAKDAMLEVKLRLRSREDLTPEKIIEQVSYLRELREVRDEIKRVAGAIAQRRPFRDVIENVLNNPGLRDKLREELGETGVSQG